MNSQSTGSLIVLLSVGLFATTFAIENVYNYDVWWHLRAGQWMLENGQVLRRDLFSFSTQGASWINYSWLWGLMFAWLHGLVGMSGLVLVKALLVGVGFAIAAHTLVRRGLNPYFVVLLVGAAVPIARFRFMLRPQSIVFLGLALLVVLLSSNNERGHRRMLILLPVTLLWANLHPSSFLVPAFALMLFGEVLIDHLSGRQRQPLLWKSLAWPLGIAVGSYLCLLVTPWGFEAHRLVIERMLEDVVTKTYWVEEHQALKWNTHVGFTVLMALTTLSFLPIWRKARLFYLAIFAITAYLAIGGVRYVGLASFVHVFVFAENLRIGLDVHRVKLAFLGSARVAAAFVPVLMFGAVAVFFLSFDGSNVYRWGLGVQESRFPTQAVDQLAKLHAKRVFNSWEVGGYLQWRLPAVQHYVDGRGLREQFALVEQVQAMGPDQFKVYLDENKVDAALLLKKDAHFNQRFEQNPDFEAVAFDVLATVYMRKGLQGANGIPVADGFRFIKPGTYDYTYLAPLARGSNAEEAEAELRRALVMTPRDFSANFLLGFFLEAQDRDEALDLYLNAAEFNPSLAFTHYNLGLRAAKFAVRKQRWNEAIEVARKSLAFDSKNAELRFLLALSLQQTGQLEEAVKVYRQIAAAEDASVVASANLGFVLVDLNRPGDALAQFEAALAQQPGFESAEYGLALATEKAGDLPRALTLWQKFFSAYPESRWSTKAEEAIERLTR